MAEWSEAYYVGPLVVTSLDPALAKIDIFAVSSPFFDHSANNFYYNMLRYTKFFSGYCKEIKDLFNIKILQYKVIDIYR